MLNKTLKLKKGNVLFVLWDYNCCFYEMISDATIDTTIKSGTSVSFKKLTIVDFYSNSQSKIFYNNTLYPDLTTAKLIQIYD